MTEDTNSESISAMERLERQNEKLRSELKELTAALDSAKKRQKHAKVPLLSELNEDKDSVTVNSKINKLKQEISKMKKELEGNLNISKITDLENHSTFLSKKIEELESEHVSLKKIEKEQQKALNSANSSNTYPEKIKKLKEDLSKAKRNYKELLAKQKEDEKIHKAQHEKCVDLEEKCRRLFDLIKKKKTEDEENKKKKEDELDYKEITEESIKRLEEKIKEAESRHLDEENKVKKRIKDIEGQVRENKHNLEMLKIKLKEKDQECRLSLLKIKELKKAVKHNQLKPLTRNQENFTPKVQNQMLHEEKYEEIAEESLEKSYPKKEQVENSEEFRKEKKEDYLEMKIDKEDSDIEYENNEEPINEPVKINSPKNQKDEPKKVDFSKPNFNF